MKWGLILVFWYKPGFAICRPSKYRAAGQGADQPTLHPSGPLESRRQGRRVDHQPSGAEGRIEELFADSGLVDVEIRKIAAPMVMESAADRLPFEQESLGALNQMLGKID
ncbi:MAG: hypothetical protein QNJ67_15545 [Kiloniellales bacterium]|nr:hypothetical protein [Kiloniellales bacterium]